MSDDLKEEVLLLKKQLAGEKVRRLRAEIQAAQAAMSIIQLRGPMLDQELDLAQKELIKLTQEQDK